LVLLMQQHGIFSVVIFAMTLEMQLET